MRVAMRLGTLTCRLSRVAAERLVAEWQALPIASRLAACWIWRANSASTALARRCMAAFTPAAGESALPMQAAQAVNWMKGNRRLESASVVGIRVPNATASKTPVYRPGFDVEAAVSTRGSAMMGGRSRPTATFRPGKTPVIPSATGGLRRNRQNEVLVI